MGILSRLFHTAARHDAKSKEGTALYVCPKCGEKRRIEDFRYKEKYAKDKLTKETTCPACGTQMKRKTILGLED